MGLSLNRYTLSDTQRGELSNALAMWVRDGTCINPQRKRLTKALQFIYYALVFKTGYPSWIIKKTKKQTVIS